jgi:hypothetical protein
LCAWSVHEASWHTENVHTLLEQSEPAWQSSPSLHGPHPAPPQSSDVSCPFFTPSTHVAAEHTAALHTRLTQSLAPPQPSPSAQALHAGPPQSLSVSWPFFAPSLHPGG